MIRTTVIGCGFMGAHHARAVAEHPSLHLSSVVDLDAKRAASVAAETNADSSSTSPMDAIEDVEAVIVASPEPVHSEQANATLDAGRHLLLEKPITDDLETAKALADRCGQVDNVTGVSFILRYDPAYAQVHTLARNGELGSIVAVRAMRAITAGESRRIGARGHPNFYMNVHDIDAILTSVNDDVVEVAANERHGELTDIDVPDAMQAILRFSNGATAVVEGYGILPNDMPGGIVAGFELIGTDGTTRVDTPGNTIEVYNDGFDRPDTRHWPIIHGEMAGAVRRQIDRFADAIEGDAAMEATIRDGYEAQVIAEAIRQAAKTGTTVDLSTIRP